MDVHVCDVYSGGCVMRCVYSGGCSGGCVMRCVYSRRHVLEGVSWDVCIAGGM